jgi:hypothetical protein
MDATIAPLVESYRIGTGLYLKALHGLDRAALITRAGPRSNPIIWMAGHLVQFRCRVSSVVGAPMDVPWGALFATGHVVTVDDADQYPPIEEVTDIWRDVSARIFDRFAALSERELSAPPPLRVATPDGTIRGALALFGFHEAYHIGQMGYMRKWLGESPLM